MRWISVLIAVCLVVSGVFAQTAAPPIDPARSAATNAVPPASPSAVPPPSADPARPAGNAAVPQAIPPAAPLPSADPPRPAVTHPESPPAMPPQYPNDPTRAAREKQQAAMARQREAIRKQAESVGAWLVPDRDGETSVRVDPPDSVKPAKLASTAAPPGPKPPCDPIGEAVVAPIIEGAAKAQNVQPKLLHAVIDQESRFHPCAVSSKGAKGLMQLMPDTAAELGVIDPFDPKENVEAGARYLRQLLDKYKGDLPQTLGAYNAGPAAVDQAGGIPNFRETRDYVQSIMQKVGTIPLDLPNIQMPKPIEN
jgi:soluble lytic murein transglycosylase-like protein